MKVSNFLRSNHVMLILLGTVLILLVPLVAMQFNDSVNWKLNDFVIAGLLLLAVGLMGDLVISKVHQKSHRIIALSALLIIFLYVWAELAVGIFTNLGS